MCYACGLDDYGGDPQQPTAKRLKQHGEVQTAEAGETSAEDKATGAQLLSDLPGHPVLVEEPSSDYTVLARAVRELEPHEYWDFI